jgi:hypothetical protein
MTQRNQAELKVHWQFTMADVRIKLVRLYPVVVEAVSASTTSPCHDTSFQGVVEES